MTKTEKVQHTAILAYLIKERQNLIDYHNYHRPIRGFRDRLDEYNGRIRDLQV